MCEQIHVGPTFAERLSALDLLQRLLIGQVSHSIFVKRYVELVYRLDTNNDVWEILIPELLDPSDRILIRGELDDHIGIVQRVQSRNTLSVIDEWQSGQVTGKTRAGNNLVKVRISSDVISRILIDGLLRSFTEVIVRDLVTQQFHEEIIECNTHVDLDWRTFNWCCNDSISFLVNAD